MLLSTTFVAIVKQVLIGIVFSALWASASVATKFGVESAPPLVLANIRFFIAGFVLLGYSYLGKRGENYRMPNRAEWTAEYKSVPGALCIRYEKHRCWYWKPGRFY